MISKYILAFFIFSSKLLNSKFVEYKGKKIKLSKNLTYLKVNEGNIKKEDIIKGKYDKKFVINKHNISVFKKENCQIFFKVKVMNNSKSSNLVIYSEIGPISSRNAKLSLSYKSSNISEYEEFQFVNTISDISKKVSLPYSYGLLKIAPGEVKVIYIEIDNSLFDIPSWFSITEIDNIIQEVNNYRTFKTALNVLNILLALSLIILYFNIRKKYLLYYFMLTVLTYFKSNTFYDDTHLFLNLSDRTYTQIYALSFALYINFLILFVDKVLKLKKTNFNLYNKLDIMRYISVAFSILFFVNVLDENTFPIIVKTIYIITFNIILYAAIKSYKNSWLSNAFLICWTPQYILYNYNMLLRSLFSNISFNFRVIELLEILVNIFIFISTIAYDAKELWKMMSRNEDANNLVDIMNNSENLEDAFNNLLEKYKKDIKFDRIMFFRRELDREAEDILYYNFSIPAMIDEREEERKYFNLNKKLHKDEIQTHFICNNVEKNELYSMLLHEEYKSFIIIRLARLYTSDLGYLIILSKEKTNYEYDEAKKDLRYKVSMLVQYFNTAQLTKTLQDRAVMEDILKKTHIEVVENLEKEMRKMSSAINEAYIIFDQVLSDLDVRNKGMIDHFYSTLRTRAENMLKKLNYNDHVAGVTSKYYFTYILIEEILLAFQEIIRKETNKVTVEIKSEVETTRPLYGVVHSIKSIIQYLVNYVYKKVMQADQATVKITTTDEEARLRIKVIVEGINLDPTTFKKQYYNVAQKTELDLLSGKLYLRSSSKGLEIIYVFDILDVSEQIIEVDKEENEEQEIIEVEEPREEEEYEDQEIKDYYENNDNYRERKD